MNEESSCPIPLGVAYRALAHVLGGHADYLAAKNLGRTGPVPEGRRSRAASLQRQGAEFMRRSVAPDISLRPSLDAAVFGYLVALASIHTDAIVGLRAEMAAAGRPGILDGAKTSDVVEVVDRILGS